MQDRSLANPFTTEPEKTPSREVVPPPPSAGSIFQQLIKWQQLLRENMSARVREFKATKSPVPVLILLGAGILYGAIHSAGPGHGKAVALSYIIAREPGMLKSLAFGIVLAFTHGLSGIFLVLGVTFIFHAGIFDSLANVTRITQVISFSLITLLGIFLFFGSIRRAIHRTTHMRLTRQGHTDPPPATKEPAFTTAVLIGLIPCPGVVMVMLFAVSLDMAVLGIAMGLAIILLGGFFLSSLL